MDADPHPGNIAVSAAGDLVFYDFGMMCETAKSKDDLLDVFFGIYEKDSNKVHLLSFFTVLRFRSHVPVTSLQ